MNITAVEDGQSPAFLGRNSAFILDDARMGLSRWALPDVHISHKWLLGLAIEAFLPWVDTVCGWFATSDGGGNSSLRYYKENWILST